MHLVTHFLPLASLRFTYALCSVVQPFLVSPNRIMQRYSIHAPGDLIMQRYSTHAPGDLIMQRYSIHAPGDLIMQRYYTHASGQKQL